MTRGNNFDALRLLGALAVLVGHQFVLMGMPAPIVIGDTHIATVAVYVFFAISGYLIAQSWQNDPDGFRFLARRFLRMAPGWFVLILLTLAVYIGLGITHFPGNPNTTFNGSLWTLEWEILCYVVLGVLALSVGLRVGAPLSMLAIGALFVAGKGSPGTELGLMFAAGATLQAFGLRRWAAAVAGSLVAIGLLASQPFAVLLGIVPVLSIWIGTQSWPYMRRADRFGDFSYGIYIYAFPVQQFGVMLLGADQPYLPMLAFSVAVAGMFAVLSWHLVEAPALGLKRYLKPDMLRSSGTPPLPECSSPYNGKLPL